MLLMIVMVMVMVLVVLFLGDGGDDKDRVRDDEFFGARVVDPDLDIDGDVDVVFFCRYHL